MSDLAERLVQEAVDRTVAVAAQEGWRQGVFAAVDALEAEIQSQGFCQFCAGKAGGYIDTQPDGPRWVHSEFCDVQPDGPRWVHSEFCRLEQLRGEAE